MYNLLVDPLLRVETRDGLQRLDLPGLLAALGQDQVTTLLGVQRHQEDAVHIFLCYLAGAVLAREELDDPCQNAEFWRDGIRNLTRADGGEDDSAWSLVVEDPTQPAFMQPPCPTTAAFSAFKHKAATPDGLDLLITAKNHDVKSTRVVNAEPEYWVYALISLQTMCGHLGVGNYGIARMNTGAGSRPVVAVEYSMNPAARWRDHTTRILAMRETLLDGNWEYQERGIVLTWLKPWDLKSKIALNTLDPFFIEVTRPRRLVLFTNNIILARSVASMGRRIDAEATNGVLGDPWTPINTADKKKGQSSLSVSGNGFTTTLLRNLILQDGYTLTPMQKSVSGRSSEPCQFTASVLVRGQGTSDGFHHVSLPIPAVAARGSFGSGLEHDSLAKHSQTALSDSNVMQNKVLKPAILSLLEAGPEQINFDKHEVAAWWEATQRDFVASWSPEFFPWLWRTIDNPDADAARLEWLKYLRTKAETSFQAAITRYPYRSGRRYRAIVRAENFLFGSMFKKFPQLKEEQRNHDHTCTD